MAQILVIDDDDAMRQLMVRLLERDGHRVWEAASGDDGIRLFGEESFDLTITDILMPGRDGMEVIAELAFRARDARIMAVSGGGRGLSSEFNLQLARDFGACQVLAKPFSREDLLAAVREALSIPDPSARRSEGSQGLVGMVGNQGGECD